jgi:beta-lactamase class A
MTTRLTRRTILMHGILLFPAGLASRVAQTVPGGRGEPGKSGTERLRDLEKKSGGRLGVAVLDTESGATLAHRADERFPMCSTFKFLAAAAVLARVDRKEESLDRRISFGRADLLEYAPATTARVGEGGMTVRELCDAAVTVSDNTAANLILATLAGPAGLTAFARSLGDKVTRLDRIEPMLNEAAPGDVRDTTAPSAMLHNLKELLLGKALAPASRDTLTAWLVANKTGNARLRAGFPAGWRVGDKTGSGSHGTTNDIAIVWPERRAAILIAAYLTETELASTAREGVLAEVGRIVGGTGLTTGDAGG